MNAQELIVIEPASALTVFTTANALEPYIAKVREEVAKFKPDLTTKKGREAIASMAAKVARVKTYVESVGKELKDEQKKIPDLIDAGRRYAKEQLQAIQDAVRKPLDDWEEAEANRIDFLKRMVQGIVDCGNGFIGGLPQSWAILLRELEEKIIVDASWDEFEAEGHRAKEIALKKVREGFAAAQKQAQEQAELEALRKEKAERDEKDRIAREAAEEQERKRLAEEARIEGERKAAEQARIAAEQKAEADRKTEAERIERERLEAENKAKAELEAAAAREQKLKDDAAKAEREKAEAEARIARIAKETEERLAAEAAEAKRKEEAELARREANKKHAARINNEAMQGFVDGGIAEDIAKLAVTLIAKKSIPHISIAY